jgi:hypothetical protein
MAQSFQRFLATCVGCGRSTSRAYARANAGKCKTCVTGIAPAPRAPRDDWRTEHKRKHGRCEDAPCCGCCGPQGDGDYYGRYAEESAMEPRD